jgi:DNA-binding NarL/FixJ family response regulator
MPIRVVLADDSFIVREGVSELLQSVDELDLVATCDDLDSLRARVARGSTPRCSNASRASCR